MKTNSIVTLISLPALLILAGCSSPAEQTTATKPTEAPHTETFVLANGKLQSNLKIPAELIANRQVDLYAKVSSYVKTLNADVGSNVHTGQLLASLEAPELIAQLSSSESKYKAQEAIYTASNATYQRILETSQIPGTISKNDVEIALAKRNSDKAQLDAAKADLKGTNTITQYLNIRAPFDGIISSRNVNLGAYTGPAGKGSDLPIFTLQELRHLRLVIAIPEATKSYIKLGDVVKFTVKAFPDLNFTATIARRSEVMDKILRSERIELDVENKDGKLSPGMVAEASLNLTGGNNAFVVPKGAVINSAEGVFLIEDVNGKAVKIPAKKGRETDSLTEVFGQELKAGATYVKRASEEIRSGSALH